MVVDSSRRLQVPAAFAGLVAFSGTVSADFVVRDLICFRLAIEASAGRNGETMSLDLARLCRSGPVLLGPAAQTAA